MLFLCREEPLGDPDAAAGHSCAVCLWYVCPWWGLSGDTHVLPLVPCPSYSLFHLFFLVLASVLFPTVLTCLADSDLAIMASFSLLPFCLHPIIMLPSAP